MSVRHISEFRDVTITNGDPQPLDAAKAFVKKVEQLEAQYVNSLDADGNSDLDNLDNVVTVLTGATPYKVYVVELTADFAAGAYGAKYLETAPNVEKAGVGTNPVVPKP